VEGDSELLVETLAALWCDVEAPVLVALQPAELDESREQGTSEGAREVRAVFDGVLVVPDRLAAGGDHHPKRPEKGPPF
jgi:hypothetical protein